MPKTDRWPMRADLRGKLVEVATRGETVNYLDLGVGRAMVGRYLHRIAMEEGKARPHPRPPLTAVVVQKSSGQPGEGFRQAMVDSGYIQKDDPRSDEQVAKAALKDVHEYWKPKLGDLLEDA